MGLASDYCPYDRVGIGQAKRKAQSRSFRFRLGVALAQLQETNPMLRVRLITPSFNFGMILVVQLR